MKNLFIVSYDQFKQLGGIDKLDRITSIGVGCKFTNESYFGYKLNEIFDKQIFTEYKTVIKKSPVFDGNDYTFYFKTYLGYGYRIDLLYHVDNKVDYKNMFSVLFSASENDPYDNILTYEVLTERNEMIEVLNRIKYILNDWISKDENRKNIVYVVGKSDVARKNKIYEYFIRICFSDWNIKYDYSSYYFDFKAFYIFK